MPVPAAERERFLGYIGELMLNPAARDAFNANPTKELNDRGLSTDTKNFLHQDVAVTGRSEIILLLEAAIDAWNVPMPLQQPGPPTHLDGSLFFLLIALWNDPVLVQEYRDDALRVLERFRVPAQERTALLTADKPTMKQTARQYFSQWAPDGPWVSRPDPPGCHPVEPAPSGANPMLAWGDPAAYVDRVTAAQAAAGATITVHGGGFQPTATVSLSPVKGGADIPTTCHLTLGSTFRCAALTATLPAALPAGDYRIVVRNPTTVLPGNVTLTVQ
jgi:hypothetical protein